MEKVVTFGEIMLRLDTPMHKRWSQCDRLNSTFGGGESNIAISLANYGVSTEYVTRLPANDIGNWCISELRKYKVQTNHILRGGDRMGIYFLEMGSVARSSKVTYDRQYSAVSDIRPGMVNWDEVFTDATWFHWTGILPAISQGAADACLEAIQEANKRNLIVSTDLNFRDTLWKYGKSAREVMPALVEGCDIVLGIMLEDIGKEKEVFRSLNPEDKLQLNAAKFEEASKEMQQRFPKIKKVVITLRNSINASHNLLGACMYSDRLYLSENYDLTHIVDRVGGGDSFFAGLIYGLLRYKNDDQLALNFASAASSIKHTVYGDFNIAQVDEVLKLMSGDHSGRINA